MKTKYFILLLSFGFPCYTGAQSTFEKVILEPVGISQPTSIIIEQDGYVIAADGYSEQDSTLYYRSGVKLVKTDFQGNVLWRKKYNQMGKAYSIGCCGSLVKINGGYLGGGTKTDSTTKYQEFYLAKYDTEGNKLWEKLYDDCWGNVDNALHGSLTGQGGYILIGETLNRNQTWADYCVVKTDSFGNMQWHETYGGSDDEIGRKAHETSEGGFILSGASKSFGAGGYDLWLTKTTSAGGIEWDKSFGTPFDDRLRHISVSKNGGYILWGSIDTVVYNTQDQFAAVVIKLDEDGGVVWRSFLNHQKERIIWQLRELEDESIVAIGEQVFNEYDYYAWIAKLSFSGEVLWERYYPNNFSTDTSFIGWSSFDGDFQQADDAGFAIAGSVWKSRPEHPHFYLPETWLVKLDSNGCFGPDSCGLAVGIKEIKPQEQNATIVAYPNPFTTQTLISIKANSATFANKEIQFQLFDVSGRLLQSVDYSLNQYGYFEFYLHRNHYPAGIYFYRVAAGEVELGKGKVVLK